MGVGDGVQQLFSCGVGSRHDPSSEMIDPRLCMFCGKDHTQPGVHSQVEVMWSNGSRMPIGLCKDCATSHVWTTPEGKTTIRDWHFKYWDENGGRYDKGITIV